MMVEEKSLGDVLVVAVSGRLDSQSAPEFEARLVKAVGGGRRRIVCNFETLEYISSAGLRVLLKLARELQAQGGRLALCCMRDYIREVFDLSGFSTIIAVEGDESRAVDRVNG